MKLWAVALILSCVISPVFLVSPINTPKVCMGTGFLPVACKEDLIASVFAGTDGAQGNLGRIGLLGPRGPKGDRASLCDQKSRTKIRCRTTYDDFLKVQREVRWMESVLHVLFGYDIDDLTKNELIKLVLTQNIKIVDDTTVIEVLDQKITNLTQKVETAGKDIHGKYIEVIKDNKKKIAEIESLTGQNKKFKDQLAELPAKEKEINDLKTQVNILKETTKGSGTAVKELTKAQARLRVIEVELKSTSEGLNAKIKVLEEAIKIKTTETAVLLEKLKVSIAAANKNAEVVGVLAAEKEKLKGTILVNQAACKTNMLAKEAELDLLKKELAALKLNCKDVEKQKLLIAALNKQIAELTKEKIPVWTTFGHDSEKEMQADNCEPLFCAKHNVKYNMEMTQIRAFVKKASHCRQYIKFRCMGAVNNWAGEQHWSWTSWDGKNHLNWAEGTGNGMCKCGMTKSCIMKDKNCNCDNNDVKVDTFDDGYITDKAQLPIIQMAFGDMGNSAEHGWHTLGKLECQ